MHRERSVSSLLLAGLFSVSLAAGCGSDAPNTGPGSEPCAAQRCLPGGGSATTGGGDASSGGSSTGGDSGGASGDRGGSGDHGGGGSPSAGSGGMAPADPALQQRIAEAIASIQSDTCFAQDDTTQCDWGEFQVAPAQFNMAKSTGEAILVIDDFSAFVPGLVRYRNRLLGFYRINGEQVQAQLLSVRLPRRLGEALVSFAGPEVISARALSPIIDAVTASYGKLTLLSYGHGGLVFSHLIELVPEQPLVLLDMAQLLDIPPGICAGIDEQTLAAAGAHFAAVAASLQQVMTEQHVHFINASFGSTVPDLATAWQRTCGGAVPSNTRLQQLLHVYEPIYDVLFNSEGVITAHAAPLSLGSPADFPFDQASAAYPNQVRVGFISSLSSGLDEVGRGVVQKVEQIPAAGDADVYFNWDCETLNGCAEPHYQFAGDFGLALGAVPFMSTSFIDPLALARLVNLRYANHGAEPMSNALIQTLRQELTPALCGAGGDQPCVYQDPIPHRELEPYRLGYE